MLLQACRIILRSNSKFVWAKLCIGENLQKDDNLAFMHITHLQPLVCGFETVVGNFLPLAHQVEFASTSNPL